MSCRPWSKSQDSLAGNQDQAKAASKTSIADKKRKERDLRILTSIRVFRQQDALRHLDQHQSRHRGRTKQENDLRIFVFFGVCASGMPAGVMLR